MTRYNLKSVLGNNVSDVRCVQALMKDQDIYYGPCDGVMTPYMGNSLQRFNKTGFAGEKVGDLHIMKPNGSTLTNLGKRASGDYADMKSLINLGEVISCKDEDWKLDIGDLTDVGMDTIETDWIRKELKKIWKDYKLPFSLHVKDFKINDKGKWQFTLHFPPLKWLQSDCNFNDVRPDFIVNDLNERLRLLEYRVTAQTKNTLTLTGPLRELVALKYETGKCATIKNAIVNVKHMQIQAARSIHELQRGAADTLRELKAYSEVVDRIQKRNKERLSDLTFGFLQEATIISAEQYEKSGKGKVKFKPFTQLIKRLNLLDINNTLLGDLYYAVALPKAVLDQKDANEKALRHFNSFNGRIPDAERKYQEWTNNLLKLHKDMEKNDCKGFSSYFYNEYSKRLSKAFIRGH